jgi:hypothetical protein
MAYGHCYDRWNHTASIMALLAAIHSDPKSGHTPSPADYHPFMEPPPLPQASPEFLRSLFAGRDAKGGS